MQQTFDKEELEHMDYHEQREEGVAMDVKRIAPLHTLLHCVRHMLSKVPIGNKPNG